MLIPNPKKSFLEVALSILGIPKYQTTVNMSFKVFYIYFFFLEGGIIIILYFIFKNIAKMHLRFQICRQISYKN